MFWRCDVGPLHSNSNPDEVVLLSQTHKNKNAQNSVVSHCYGEQNGGEVTDLVGLHVWVRREARLHYYW